MAKMVVVLPTGLPVSTENNDLSDGATKSAPIEPQGFLSQPVAPGTARNIETGSPSLSADAGRRMIMARYDSGAMPIPAQKIVAGAE